MAYGTQLAWRAPFPGHLTKVGPDAFSNRAGPDGFASDPGVALRARRGASPRSQSPLLGWARFPAFEPRASSRPAVETDPLLAFALEDEAEPNGAAPVAEAEPQPTQTVGRHAWLMLAAAVGLTAVVTFGLTWTKWVPGNVAGPQPAKLTITTRPEGAQVTIDGEPRGVTPLALSVNSGAHTISVRSGSHERVIPITVAPGADIVRDLEMTGAAPAAASGLLSIVTEPPGARVTIDGQPSGTSPVTVDALTAGQHTIEVASATGSARRTVTVVAGQAASIVFSLPRVSGPVGGWLSVSAPFDVQIMERGELIGASGAARIMLAAGSHEIVLVNQTLDYQETRRVNVVAGQTALVRIEPPAVNLNINARPWADVTLDGKDLGQTPISNASVTVGTHELVFRHPQLGERRQTVVVTSNGPQRVAVDLTK